MIITTYIVCLIVGLAMDWAIYERVILYLQVWWQTEEAPLYRRTLLPRVLVTLASLMSFSYGMIDTVSHDRFLLGGIIGFLLSSVYACVITFRKMQSTQASS